MLLSKKLHRLQNNPYPYGHLQEVPCETCSGSGLLPIRNRFCTAWQICKDCGNTGIRIIIADL